MTVRVRSARLDPSDRFDLDRLCRLFDFPHWEDVSESSSAYFAEAYSAGEKSLDEDATDAEREAAGIEAEREATDEVYRNWYGAVMTAAEQVFEQHGLVLEGCRVRRKVVKRPHEFRLQPAESWEDAARKIMDTVNGVGLFTFSSLREFLESGPYTARQAVLTHVGWTRDRAEVYGTSSARRIYEQAWR